MQFPIFDRLDEIIISPIFKEILVRKLFKTENLFYFEMKVYDK